MTVQEYEDALNALGTLFRFKVTKTASFHCDEIWIRGTLPVGNRDLMLLTRGPDLLDVDPMVLLDLCITGEAIAEAVLHPDRVPTAILMWS